MALAMGRGLSRNLMPVDVGAGPRACPGQPQGVAPTLRYPQEYALSKGYFAVVGQQYL